MKAVEARRRTPLKNILYLTDFSESSQGALPFAASIAREYDSTIYALHVLVPAIYPNTPAEWVDAAAAIQEECAEKDMRRVAYQLAELHHATIVQRGVDIGETLERTLKEHDIDLIVLGTHGRTGAERFLPGSVAEEVFRRSGVPVLTIGPLVPKGYQNNARFRRVLYATDFTSGSLSAAPYANSLAQEHEAQLILLHVIRGRQIETDGNVKADNVANAIYELRKLVPQEAESWWQPDTVVDYGEPAERILEIAKQRGADLIVLGICESSKHMGAPTHLEPSTAFTVVAHAICPMLTVRG
jgi:nucleotide-binding universal stress UspA family protein